MFCKQKQFKKAKVQCFFCASTMGCIADAIASLSWAHICQMPTVTCDEFVTWIHAVHVSPLAM